MYEGGTIAIVEAVSPELGNRVQRVRVQLPGTSQELLTKFRERKVDFAAHTNTEDGGAVFLNLLGIAFSSFHMHEPTCVSCEVAPLTLLTQHHLVARRTFDHVQYANRYSFHCAPLPSSIVTLFSHC